MPRPRKERQLPRVFSKEDIVKIIEGASTFKHLDPLTAIHQIIQHVLPRHFQKSRHYGLHNTCTQIRQRAETAIKVHPATVRTTLQIITDLLKRDLLQYPSCQGLRFIRTKFPPDSIYLSKYMPNPTNRVPPQWKVLPGRMRTDSLATGSQIHV